MKTQEQILKEFFELAEQIGFSIYFNTENSDELEGFIVGTEHYFSNIIDGEEDLNDYSQVMDIETGPSSGGLH